MASTRVVSYWFGPFRLDGRDLRLQRDGQPVELTPKGALLLLALLQAEGRVVSRAELDERVWAGTEVGLGSLPFQVYLLRRALGDERGAAPIIETVPRRGYRVALPVRVVDAEGAVDAGTPGAEAVAASLMSAAAPADADPPGIRATIPAARARPKGRAVRWGLAAGLVAMFVAVDAAVSERWAPQPMPRVSRFVQLSRDGRPKSFGDPILFDGSRVYFREGPRTRFSTVPANGGETAAAGDERWAINDFHGARTEYLAVKRRDTEGDGELWMASMVSGLKRRIGQVHCRWASWSPDGSEIACAAQASLRIVAEDGASRSLPVPAGDIQWPRWSPDGRVLRFTTSISANRTVTTAIWEVRRNGTGLRPVFTGRGVSRVCCGSWSPDGRFYVFEARDGEASHLWVRRERAVWPWHEPEEAPRRLTNGPLSFYAPTWSADGRRILVFGVQPGGELVRYDAGLRTFVPYAKGLSATWVSFSRRGDLMYYSAFPEHVLWRARTDGTDRRQLTFPPLEVDGAQASPDGKWIAIRAAPPGHDKKIYLVPGEGGIPEPLTDADVAQGVPTWSADSRRIAFGDVPPVFGRPVGGEAIHVYDIVTKELRDVPGSEGLWTSRWSPDGRSLAALTIRDLQLRILDVRSGRWRAFAVSGLDDLNWSRDGRYLFSTTIGSVRFMRRVRVADGRVDDIANLDVASTPASWWAGLSADDSPIMLRNIGALEVYALEVQVGGDR